jgi:maltooligosyltrehalose trehalohydrolase
MAANPFKWGTPNTWDLGWDWQKLSGQWDFGKLTFNDDQKAKYERLLQVPADQRAGNAEYQALPPADRQVFDDLSKMSKDQRDQAMVNITRQQTFNFYKDAIALRRSSPAFQAGAEVKRIYSHNDNSVMAYERKSGLEDYIVVAPAGAVEGGLQQRRLHLRRQRRGQLRRHHQRRADPAQPPRRGDDRPQEGGVGAVTPR